MRDVLGGAQAGTAAIAGQLQSFMQGLPKLPGLGHKGHSLDLGALSGLLGGIGGGAQAQSQPQGPAQAQGQAQAQMTTPPVTPTAGAGAYTGGQASGANAYAALKQALSTYPSMASSQFHSFQGLYLKQLAASLYFGIEFGEKESRLHVCMK